MIVPTKTEQQRQAQETEGNGHRVVMLPIPLPVPVPAPVREPKNLIYYGALGGLAITGLIEWPVALLIGVGYTLLANRKNSVRAMAEEIDED